MLPGSLLQLSLICQGSDRSTGTGQRDSLPFKDGLMYQGGSQGSVSSDEQIQDPIILPGSLILIGS